MLSPAPTTRGKGRSLGYLTRLQHEKTAERLTRKTATGAIFRSTVTKNSGGVVRAEGAARLLGVSFFIRFAMSREGGLPRPWCALIRGSRRRGRAVGCINSVPVGEPVNLQANRVCTPPPENGALPLADRGTIDRRNVAPQLARSAGQRLNRRQPHGRPAPHRPPVRACKPKPPTRLTASSTPSSPPSPADATLNAEQPA